jgi:heme/copper-type cytochrome/quinol oxidase subunit 2
MKKILMIFMFIMLVMIIAACGGGDKASGDGSTVTINASNWEFDKAEYKVAAGDVTVNLKNAEGYHGITIEGTKMKIDGEGNAKANLKPGTYKIICSVPCGEGHQEMSAMLVVE